ncbi:alpha/beta hydrolase [Acinetobacter towneri]|uniref:alpha/beta hydrolase n=1 Tax=Acinetobacter towneri TaxID=202956 RepID=UPI003A85C8F3
MMENNQPILTEEMQMFDYWSEVYSPADQHIDSLRAAYDAFQQHYTLPRTEEIQVEDTILTLSSHSIDLRVFTPEGNAPKKGWSWIFYVHGGGNVVGSADSHEYIARQLARDLKVKVFLPEYGLVPEFDWEQGHKDCVEAYQCIIENMQTWNICSDKNAIVADGSGVEIALQLQQTLADQLKPKILGLIFPSFMPQNSDSKPIQSLVYQIEDQNLMQDWTGISAKSGLRHVPHLHSALPTNFVALTQYDCCADANMELLSRLQRLSANVEVHMGKGLRANCLPLLRDCQEVASIYDALLKFFKLNFLEINHSV